MIGGEDWPSLGAVSVSGYRALDTTARVVSRVDVCVPSTHLAAGPVDYSKVCVLVSQVLIVAPLLGSFRVFTTVNFSFNMCFLFNITFETKC